MKSAIEYVVTHLESGVEREVGRYGAEITAVEAILPHYTAHVAKGDPVGQLLGPHYIGGSADALYFLGGSTYRVTSVRK
jgi:hypothetical protein